MGNYAKVKGEVKNYIIARSPLIVVDSLERERVERLLREIARENSFEIHYYTDSKQVCALTGGGTMDVDHDPLAYVATYFKKKPGATFVIGDIKRVGEDNSYSRDVLNLLYLAKERNGTLILITPDPVWSRLAQFGMQTTLDYPDNKERLGQVQNFLNLYRSRYAIRWSPQDVTMAATLLRGFSEIQIENILSTTLVANQALEPYHLQTLTAQKSQLYATVPSIQKVAVDPRLTVSGLEALKDWLASKRDVFFAPDEALQDRDISTPKGILLAGVPGCGKSFSAKMVAQQWGLPLFRFDVGSIYDKWIGESEKKMKEALQFMDNVSPCVVWVDEIEKALSVSDTGNDTGKRVLGQFLFWLQESKSRVFLVATANDISLLPYELFRKGRFSQVFFVDLPQADERKSTLEQYAKKALHITIPPGDMEEMVAASEGFSYSDLEYVIKDVAQLALLEGQGVVTHQLMMETFRQVVPISQSNPEIIGKIRAWGEKRAVAASRPSGGNRE